MKVSLRRILKKDWNYILNLRNNDKFRENFYQQHKISKTEHFEYLNKQKSNPNFFNWIICYGKNDVGYIRILDNDVSIIIDEKFHNRDIGSKSLKLLETEAKISSFSDLGSVIKIMILN